MIGPVPALGAIELSEPRGLWALALLVPVVLLHLYRRRRRRLEVAFLPLLRETAGATTAQGAWKNLHETASLLLRCAALVAVALALAGPRPAREGPPPRDLVLVLDADVTTQAVEQRTPKCTWTRFGRELALAEALVAANGEGRFSVVVAGPEPHPGASGSRDPGDLRRLPYDPWVSDARADLSAAVRAATAAGDRERSPRVVLITSRAAPADMPDDVEVLGAGSAKDDQGIVDQAVEASANGIHRSVRLTLRNFGGATRTRRVTARTEHGVVLDRDVEMPAGAEVEVRFDVLPPRDGALLSVSLEGEDALSWDDRTGAWLAPLTRPSVLVVHGGSPRPFVTAVLDAMGDAVDRDASGSVLASDLPRAKPRDVTIVDGAALPAGTALAGGWVFLAPFAAGTSLPFSPGRTVSQPLVWRQDLAHALLRGVDLSTAYVAQGTTLNAKGAEFLAFAEGEPVVAEGGTADGGRWIAFGLHPEGSDLPLRAALPVLLRNAIRRLGVAPAEMLKPFYRAGEVVRPSANLAWFRPVEAAAFIPRGGIGPCGDPPVFRPPPTWEGDHVPPGWRGEAVRYEAPGVRATTAFVDLSREVDITPVRPAATPPPPAPPTPDREAAAARWRATLVAAAAAFLLADLLLLALQGRKLRGGKVAAPPARA